MSKKIVISYVRVSTKEQLKEYSIEAQTEMLDNYVKTTYRSMSWSDIKTKGKRLLICAELGLSEY